MDLPIDDPAAGLAEYAEAALPFVPDQEAVLVGHSLGASVIPLVAAQRLVRQMVFLCPVIRRPGMSVAEQAPLDADISSYDLGAGRTFFDDSSSAWEPAAATAAFFPDADPETEWPEGKRSAVVTTDDRLIGIDWARNRIPEILGVTPAELPGGHSPFLSRPAELAGALARAVEE